MASIPASTADTNAAAALATLQAADNANFIAAADLAIADAISQGRNQISTNTFGNVNPQTVTEYYVNLGYKVSFPDFRHRGDHQPAQLFGEFWVAFWNNTLTSFEGSPTRNPVRIILGW